MSLQADLRQVIFALSDALDLVGIDDVGHGKRVGIMAAECAKAAGLPEAKTAFLFDLGMLHDVGVSSTEVHRKLIAEFDWQGSQTHCETGHTLLQGFAPLAPMALPVRYHHTRWEQLVASEIDPTVARQANLVLLADRVDALSAPYSADNTVLLHTDEVRAQIQQRTDSYFAPDLVEQFLGASRSEAFWLLLEPRSTQLYMQDVLSKGPSFLASIEDLRQLAEIFSRIVDAKSPYTAEHSLGVAGLARFLGERMGLSKATCDKLEIAGLLHDLGKLRVPDQILDKPGPLDPRERLIINTHSFETFQILRHIKGFEEITKWAAYHHEEPDGEGYPFRLRGDALSLEARIMRVADIYQALVQDRPYRRGLTSDRALGFMKELARQGRLDADVLAVVAVSEDQALVAARGRRVA